MIKITGVTKRYGKIVAVNNLDLHIEKGEFFGLLGPNGAGKTTLIKILTTLSRPDSGTLTINGHDVTKDLVHVKASVGLVPQHTNLDMELTVWENLELHGLLFGLPKKERRQTIEELLTFTELTEHRQRLAGSLSGGMKRRLLIARALLHRPRLLFLDEPTIGLDPYTRRKIWDLLKSMNNAGLTILLTTHYIEEAAALCNRVALIDHGSIVALGSPSELKNMIGSYVVVYDDQGVTRYNFFSDREAAVDFARQITQNVTIRETNLEDVFLRLTSHPVAE
ncbi:MAG: ATP-binding cassette domain-containing protein [Firmicutes bacterium]|nr:ATP-binding cassette domain-containing protein [Bacillota bacterium]MCL5040027.1 ATP-binding cassette domain-containing protein [Bacillota bacterium]